jgi:hypothetical protein
MHWSYNAGVEANTPALFIANIEDAATIAGVLTAPPRGGGPWPCTREALPRTGRPATLPSAATRPVATPAPGGAPATAAPPAGRGRGNATGHTPAYWLKFSANADGSFTIANPRNGFSKTYGKR